MTHLAKGLLITTLLNAEQAAWPYSVPCRIQDSGNNELMVATLGDVKTSLAQDIFDPKVNKVMLSDGTIM